MPPQLTDAEEMLSLAALANRRIRELTAARAAAIAERDGLMVAAYRSQEFTARAIMETVGVSASLFWAAVRNTPTDGASGPSTHTPERKF